MRSDLRLLKLKAIRKGIIKTFIVHETRRDKINFPNGAFVADWDQYTTRGIQSQELLDEWDTIQNQINELQN